MPRQESFCTQITCSTGTKVQILWCMHPSVGARVSLVQHCPGKRSFCAHFTCFTVTDVQILTQKEPCCQIRVAALRAALCASFTLQQRHSSAACCLRKEMGYPSTSKASKLRAAGMHGKPCQRTALRQSRSEEGAERGGGAPSEMACEYLEYVGPTASRAGAQFTCFTTTTEVQILTPTKSRAGSQKSSKEVMKRLKRVVRCASSKKGSKKVRKRLSQAHRAHVLRVLALLVQKYKY